MNFDFKLAGRRMRTLLLLMMLILLGGTGLARAEDRPDFTAQELQWIQQHPMVTYTVKELWPQEYEENGRHLGLSRDFLDDIEQQTGIHFVYVPAGDKSAAPPMMISSVLESLLSPQEKKGWLFTSDWISAIPMLIARNETKHVRNLSGLAGRTLAVIQGGEYQGWLRLNYPQVKLLPFDSAKEALQAVEDNRADAALGSGLIMLPIYQRLYYHTLSIASQLPELASGIHMAVADNYPELQGIINKALDNLTARDIQSTYLKWFTVMDIGTPTFGVLVQYYWWQILLFSVLLILLIWAIRNALLAKRRAQRSEAEKSAFLAMMSHEIRTPMNALVASLELLRHSSTKSKQLEYTDLAFSSSQNLLGLLNDVLDHSKLSHMHPQLERHSMDIGELLNAVCESQRPSAEKKGLRLNLELQANLPGYWIVADSHRLRQIVNNLLSNAIKFTEQGSITLEARLEKSSADGQDHLTVDILDTGIGIPDEAKRRLFIAWYQAESFTARHYGGSGLGLYICNELVNAMQGRLSMESQVGKGSRFTFTVPVEPYGLTNSTQPMAEPVLPRFNHQISVLVVEDHPANQQVIAGQLDMLQCHYEMASEGEAAMNLLEDENYYDLILLDCNLPGRDGYQLTEDIRQLEQQRQLERTPIIAISALNSQAHYARCKLSGMDDVMTKPIVLPELADVLVKWCPEAASRAQYEMRQEPELTLQPAMKSWLMQDLADFRRAAEAEDLRFMTYSIHRIKGVAQMYNLPDLAEYSADIERQLHEAKGDENWPLAELAETRAAVRQVIPQVIASGFGGVILNITNPCDVITQIIQQTSGFPHSQVLGTGTSLDTARMKRVVGEFFGFDPKSVTGYVLGEHGESQFVAWSTVRLGGRPVAELAGDRDVDWAQMDDRVRGGGWDILQGKGWTSFGIATATARLVDVILSDANSVYPVSAWDENFKVYIGQPAVIGKRGVVQTLMPELTAYENIAYHASSRVILAAINSEK